MGPVLTMLALLALRAVLHSSGPRLTRHGTCDNHACPPRLPFTLDVELGREIIFHNDLATLVIHTLVETSLVAKISIVHQSPKPKPQRQGSIELHLDTLQISSSDWFRTSFWMMWKPRHFLLP